MNFSVGTSWFVDDVLFALDVFHTGNLFFPKKMSYSLSIAIFAAGIFMALLARVQIVMLPRINLRPTT